MKNFNILLIEDDDIDIKKMTKLLDNVKSLTIAHDGIEGLEVIKKVPRPLIIIMDINMPNMDGLTFLKELRKDSKFNNVPVIVFSASENVKDKLEAYDLHVAG